MALGPAYEHDVFVTYAHADNEKPQASSAEFGWVTTLTHNLNTGPNVFHKRLFIDHRLKPGDVFSDDLVTKVRNSALLLVLLTQNYIDSAWCGAELDHFVRAHGNDPDEPADVFVVELVPYETLNGVPAAIQKVRKRLIHARFWHQPADAASPVLAGYPTPRESGPEAERHYWRALNELRGAIDSRLRARSSPATPGEVAPTSSPQPTTEPPLGTVLLADTTDDLVSQRDCVKAALEPDGVAVLPAGDYVGLSPDEFETTIATDLKRSDLFVQLLSPTVGRRLKGFAAPLPQLQLKRALAARLPIMQWCERLPLPKEIADPAHARLFETEHLRATSRTGFESEVIARLKAMKQARGAARSAERESPPPPGKKLLFIDDVAGEPALNQRLRGLVHAANCAVRSLPAGAPLGSNGIDIAQLLRPCRAGITVFADNTKFTTVFNRLVFFLNQIAEASLPVVRWGLYLTPRTVGCDFGLPSEDLVSIDEQRLADFLRGL